jgi:hypothetical protein
MSDLLGRISAINVLPSRDQDAFDTWLTQRDAFDFLKANITDKISAWGNPTNTAHSISSASRWLG